MMHQVTLRVRFGETDRAGHVNNAVYLTYLEEGRLEFLHDVLQLDAVPIILASVRLDFLHQVFFRDQITVQTGVCRLGHKSFDMVHLLWRQSPQQLAVRAVSTLVVFDYETQRTMPIPNHWRPLLEAHWADPPDPHT